MQSGLQSLFAGAFCTRGPRSVPRGVFKTCAAEVEFTRKGSLLGCTALYACSAHSAALRVPSEGMRLCACAALLLALAHAALAQYAYEDGVDFYDDYSLYNAGYDAYQEEEDSFYANEYMGPYDEPYDDFGLEEREDLRADCRIGADGTPQFNSAYLRPADAAAPAAFASSSTTCPCLLFWSLPKLGFWGQARGRAT